MRSFNITGSVVHVQFHLDQLLVIYMLFIIYLASLIRNRIAKKKFTIAISTLQRYNAIIHVIM